MAVTFFEDFAELDLSAAAALALDADAQVLRVAFVVASESFFESILH